MHVADLIPLLPGPYRRALAPPEDGVVRHDPLLASMEAMAALLGPVEEILEQVDRWIDPALAPDAFIPWLATWVSLGDLVRGAERREHSAPHSWRRLIEAAHRLQAQRGTKAGLVLFLELATDQAGFEIDDRVQETAGGPLRAAHFEVRAPKAAERYRRLIEAIVAREAPAATTHVVRFEDP